MEIFSSLAQTKLTDKNNRLIVFDFYATHCDPCKMMKPILKELEREYNNVDFYKIHVETNRNLCNANLSFYK